VHLYFASILRFLLVEVVSGYGVLAAAAVAISVLAWLARRLISNDRRSFAEHAEFWCAVVHVPSPFLSLFRLAGRLRFLVQHVSRGALRAAFVETTRPDRMRG
jgi:hypothetical protein